jgi:hypothetical protein
MNYSSWASCQRSKGRFEELNAGEGSFVSVTGSYCQGSSCLFLLSPSLQEEPPQSANEAFLGGFYLCIWKSQICKEFKVLGKVHKSNQAEAHMRDGCGIFSRPSTGMAE